MKKDIFIGRHKELDRLEALHKKGAPGLAVIKGRRRIGKSRLVAQFALMNPKNRLLSFAGLAPQEGVNSQEQRDHFGRQLAQHCQMAPLTFTDWSDAFAHLSSYLQADDIVLFDEISWMGDKDPSFIPKLKVWWDQQKLPFILVFCGSVSTWIEENILQSAAFFGRIHLTITLEPLSIEEGGELLKARGYQGSSYDTYKLLSLFGGVPWHLEQVSSGQTADHMIAELCFRKDSLLVLEFDRIFHDLFNGKGATYKKILGALQDGMKTLAEVRGAIQFSHSGTLSSMMEHLITAGFVKKQSLWSFKTTKPRKQSLYRISDPYMRFYLKVIAPQRSKIEQGSFQDVTVSQIPGFDAHIGLQLEYLLLQNRPVLLKALGILPTDVVADGPYRQTKGRTRAGCQVDYLIQTTTRNLFVCEFKFKRQEIGVEIIAQMEEKIAALKVPRSFAAIPVLFHVGGVAPSVATGGYFYRVIDITDFLGRVTLV